MKKIIASASLTVLGAVSLQAASDMGMSPVEKSKFWTLGLRLSGFYDDNYLTANSAAADESIGIAISPSVGINLVLDQTKIEFNYIYGLRWYEDRPDNETDQSHEIDLGLNHSFSDRAKLSLLDSFRYSSEPDIIDSTVVAAPTLRRSNQDAMRNLIDLGFDFEVSPRFGLGVSYHNGWYDYDQDGNVNSLSALLDRIEHTPGVAFRWFAAESTTASFNYKYAIASYTGDDQITAGTPPVLASADTRDYNSHVIYLGVAHTFNPSLSAGLDLGAQITDYSNALATQDDSETTPYVDANLNWAYNPGSSLKVGVRNLINATDIADAQSQESTVFYGTLTHRITPQLTGGLAGWIQASRFNGGASDGETDLLGGLGASLSYAINSFLSADAGYNYDSLGSDIPGRSYRRNRVSIGLSAKY